MGGGRERKGTQSDLKTQFVAGQCAPTSPQIKDIFPESSRQPLLKKKQKKREAEKESGGELRKMKMILHKS
jgi:hypothetical protein